MTEDNKKNNKKNRIVLIIVAVIMIVAYWNGQNLKDIENVDYGFWSIVPALIAVILAFITREAIFALLLASIVGVLILGNSRLYRVCYV